MIELLSGTVKDDRIIIRDCARWWNHYQNGKPRACDHESHRCSRSVSSHLGKPCSCRSPRWGLILRYPQEYLAIMLQGFPILLSPVRANINHVVVRATLFTILSKSQVKGNFNFKPHTQFKHWSGLLLFFKHFFHLHNPVLVHWVDAIFSTVLQRTRVASMDVWP